MSEKGQLPRFVAMLPVAGLASLLVVPLASILLELGWYPSREVAHSDYALLELNTLLAGRGEQLLGAYSRYGWHHPGPAPFYLAAPFYALSGHASTGLNVFAGLWNLTCLAIAALAWFRPLPGRHRAGRSSSPPA